MRISDWSSDVCSSDLAGAGAGVPAPRGALVLDAAAGAGVLHHLPGRGAVACAARDRHAARALRAAGAGRGHERRTVVARRLDPPARAAQGERSQPALATGPADRSEEHTSELQSLMRTSYAGFCLKKKKNEQTKKHYDKELQKQEKNEYEKIY